MTVHFTVNELPPELGHVQLEERWAVSVAHGLLAAVGCVGSV